MDSIKNTINTLGVFTKYSIKIIFAGKFHWFALSALLVFIINVAVHYFSQTDIEIKNIYNILLISSLILAFYPSVYCIQHDIDCKSTELLFSIPNYRYKIWLTRIMITYSIIFGILYLFSELNNLFILEYNTFAMSYQVMFPVCAFGLYSFFIATFVKNGNGASIIVIITGIFLFILKSLLQNSMWNILLNPWDIPTDMNEIIWNNIVFNNRLTIVGLICFFLLLSLMNLQNREKFIH